MPDRMRQAVETVLAAWSSGDVQRLDEVCAPSCVFHTPPFPDMDLAVEKAFIQAFRTGLPDFTIRQVEGIVEGETTCHRYLCSGTHTGFNPLIPVEPNGRWFETSGCWMAHWVDGKAVEVWHYQHWLCELQHV
jgi:ketosteroid isomerase-like protein